MVARDAGIELTMGLHVKLGCSRGIFDDISMVPPVIEVKEFKGSATLRLKFIHMWLMVLLLILQK